EQHVLIRIARGTENEARGKASPGDDEIISARLDPLPRQVLKIHRLILLSSAPLSSTPVSSTGNRTHDFNAVMLADRGCIPQSPGHDHVVAGNGNPACAGIDSHPGQELTQACGPRRLLDAVEADGQAPAHARLRWLARPGSKRAIENGFTRSISS